MKYNNYILAKAKKSGKGILTPPPTMFCNCLKASYLKTLLATLLLTVNLSAQTLIYEDPSGVKWNYTVLDDGTVKLGGNTYSTAALWNPYYTTGDVIVPTEIDNKPVSCIQSFYNSNITTITFTKPIKVVDGYMFFSNCKKLEKVNGLNFLNVSEVTDMNRMFGDCKMLKTLEGVENWDVSNVTDFGQMCSYCESLQSIDALANWDVTGITSEMNRNYTSPKGFYYMFSNCSSLTDLTPLANWDVSNNTTMFGMFSNCTGIESLEGLENWDVSHVTTMYTTFNYCQKLNNISALQNWNTGKVTNMCKMFYHCSALSDLKPLVNWNVSSVNGDYGGYNNGFAYMFYECSSIQNLQGLENWDINANVFHMFYANTSLTEASAIANWDVSDVYDFRSMFRGCKNLTDVSALNIWNMAHAVWLSSMFEECDNLVEVSLPDWKFEINGAGKTSDDISYNGVQIDGIFENCDNLKRVNLANWNLSGIKRGYEMFNYCKNLEYVDLSNVTGGEYSTEVGISVWESVFNRCTSLKRLSLPPVMFRGTALLSNCTALEEITIPSGVTELQRYAIGCYDAPISEITLPANITKIQSSSLYCYNLKSVYCMATTPPSWVGSPFYENNNNLSTMTLYVKTSALEAYRTDPNWSKFGTITDQIPFTIAAGKQYSTLAVDFDADFSETEGIAPYVAAKYYEGRTAAAKVASAYQRAGMPAKAKAAADDNTIRTIVVAQFTDKYIPSRTGDDNFTFHGALIYGKPGTYYYKMGERDYASGNQVTEDWENNYMMPAYETWQLSPTYMQEPENWMCYPKNDSYNFVLKDGRFKYIDNQGSIPRHKAWLSLPSEIVSGTYQEAGAKMAITFEDGDTGNTETTGITFITEQKDRDGNVTYNLAGQQVDDAYKGMVIRNGKTFIKK